MKSYIFFGISISKGVAIGKPLFLSEKVDVWSNEILPADEVEREIHRYRGALKKSKRDLEHLQKRYIKDGPSVVVAILDAHLEILHDPIITEIVEAKIKDSRKNTETVFSEVINTYKSSFKNVDDFIEDRIKDIKDVSRRILGHLNPYKKEKCLISCKNSIILAKELIPSNALEAQYKEVLAFVTQKGGYVSHAGIIARARGIPYVAKIDLELFKNIEIKQMIVDGINGKIILNPSPALVLEYQELKKHHERCFKEIKESSLLECKTLDKVKINIFSNVDALDDIDSLLDQKSEGVGLFRSEYLFLSQKKVPSFDFQLNIYKELLERLKERPVVVRLFDIGDDKKHFLRDYEELSNKGKSSPSSRSRSLLKNQEIFQEQIKALLQANIYGNLKILIPFVTDIEEFRWVKEQVDLIRIDLKKQGHIVKKVPLGCMIEVPSAAIMIDLFAKEADFFSIGTNDLTQFVIAADRSSPDASHLFDFSHPSLIRLLKMILEGISKKKKKVAICGEMAADPKFTRLLIGMGFRDFSISPRHIALIKHIVRKTKLKEAAKIAKKALSIQDTQQLKNFIMQQSD